MSGEGAVAVFDALLAATHGAHEAPAPTHIGRLGRIGSAQDDAPPPQGSASLDTQVVLPLLRALAAVSQRRFGLAPRPSLAVDPDPRVLAPHARCLIACDVDPGACGPARDAAWLLRHQLLLRTLRHVATARGRVLVLPYVADAARGPAALEALDRTLREAQFAPVAVGGFGALPSFAAAGAAVEHWAAADAVVLPLLLPQHAAAASPDGIAPAPLFGLEPTPTTDLAGAAPVGVDHPEAAALVRALAAASDVFIVEGITPLATPRASLSALPRCVGPVVLGCGAANDVAALEIVLCGPPLSLGPVPGPRVLLVGDLPADGRRCPGWVAISGSGSGAAEHLCTLFDAVLVAGAGAAYLAEAQQSARAGLVPVGGAAPFWPLVVAAAAQGVDLVPAVDRTVLKCPALAPPRTDPSVIEPPTAQGAEVKTRLHRERRRRQVDSVAAPLAPKFLCAGLGAATQHLFADAVRGAATLTVLGSLAEAPLHAMRADGAATLTMAAGLREVLTALPAAASAVAVGSEAVEGFATFAATRAGDGCRLHNVGAAPEVVCQLLAGVPMTQLCDLPYCPLKR